MADPRRRYSLRISRSLRLLIAGISLTLAGCGGGGQDGDAGHRDTSAQPDTELDSLEDVPLEIVEVTCWSCHGTEGQEQPPSDIVGNHDATAIGVGAHNPHMLESDWHPAVLCESCHPVPETVEAEGHIDTTRPADVELTGVASIFVENPGYNPEDGTCATYCHGGAMHIDRLVSPAWTNTDGVSCGGCHGMPPSYPHPDDSDCVRCHDNVGNSERILRRSFHIDSLLAAPKDAHLVHLGGAEGEMHECNECHEGDHYHGPLKDGEFLPTTTICTECHDDGRHKAEWQSYDPY